MGTIESDRMLVFDREPYLGGKPTGETISLDDARWLTPCVPSKLIALWNNYFLAATKNGWLIPQEPLYFLKAPNCYSAHLEPILQPESYDGRIVYEGELGVVLGKECCSVSVADAARAIFGFTCVNDVTALDLLHRDASFAQWTRAKSFDRFGVFGPAIVTGLDPLTLTVRTLVNGRERQNYPVSDIIFTPAELVSRISRDMTLFPGDLIACGTSLGVLPLRRGNITEVMIGGIGTLRNPFSSAADAT